MSENKKDGQGEGPSKPEKSREQPRRRSFNPLRRRKKPTEGATAQETQGAKPQEQGGSKDSAKNTSRNRRSGGERGRSQGNRGNSQSNRGNSQSNRGNSQSNRGNSQGNRRNSQGNRDVKGQERAAVSELTRRHDPAMRSKDPEIEEVIESPAGDFETMSISDINFLKPHEVDENILLDDAPETDFSIKGNLRDMVGIKLHLSEPVDDYDCQDLILVKGDVVIVETGRGLVLGEVVVPTTRRIVKDDNAFRVIRKATENDMRQRDRNRQKEEQAQQLCQESIDRFRLNMKLIKVDYLHGGNKAVFYFSSDGRVDFRELVRELARTLHIRIEMRQIGVRDASRILGGLGACGQQLCCNKYIREFAPVSIRMAKDQDLVLNPEKVSGLCGRLMCCLSYEDQAYKHASKNMPKLGRRVLTPKGEGRVKDRDVLRQLVRVYVSDEPGLHEFPVDEIKPLGGNESSGRNPEKSDNNPRDNQ